MLKSTNDIDYYTKVLGRLRDWALLHHVDMTAAALHDTLLVAGLEVRLPQEEGPRALRSGRPSADAPGTPLEAPPSPRHVLSSAPGSFPSVEVDSGVSPPLPYYPLTKLGRDALFAVQALARALDGALEANDRLTKRAGWPRGANDPLAEPGRPLGYPPDAIVADATPAVPGRPWLPWIWRRCPHGREVQWNGRDFVHRTGSVCTKVANGGGPVVGAR